MRKLLVVALLAAFAPLGLAHATPKPMPTKSAMSGKMSGTKMMPMKGTKKHTKKHGKKMTTGKKMMPMRDPKTGRFMKSSSTTKSSSTMMSKPVKK